MRLRFMAGLPRSGTTLLAAILSQNDAVYLSPQSDLSEHLRVVHQHQGEDVRLGVLGAQHDALLRGAPAAFYSGMDDRTVIDKSRRWGAPYYLRLLDHVLGEPPRILTPVRPLADVVASFVRKAQDNPDTNYIDRQMIAEDFLPYWRKPLDDARVDWLLAPGGMLDAAMLSVASAFRDETAHLFHIYTYADLVTDPGKTIDGIYEFLGAERFPHTFDTIPAAEPHADADVLGVPDLHTVRPALAVTAPPPEDVLSDYALTRCAVEDFWTE
jgi:sulfotransferase